MIKATKEHKIAVIGEDERCTCKPKLEARHYPDDKWDHLSPQDKQTVIDLCKKKRKQNKCKHVRKLAGATTGDKDTESNKDPGKDASEANAGDQFGCQVHKSKWQK